ncbi:MAG: GNAT family N-acetyltransferase [Candidatus Eisenbacteria bacterium]|jgi:RimJ/RimL family protein N-acetyltransferase|nr:GNAT family N-acetyltransferase [Candidatus Eisenbacteria bacterium]
MELDSRRLILRTFCESDLAPFCAYRSDSEVARYQSWVAPYPRDKAAAFMRDMRAKEPGEPGQWYQLAIVVRSSRRMVGDCAFHILAEDPRQAEVAFTLARRHQGHGYATEAVARLLGYLFDEFDLHRVIGICDAENAPSARLLERVGMRREAHHVESHWLKGEWTSEYVYAMLQREWRGRHEGGGTPCFAGVTAP